MKRVLHVGLVAPGYSNAGLMKAFFENSFTEYTLFDFQLKSFEFGKDTMRSMLIQEAERLKPDLVFLQIQGSDILDLETFQKLSRIALTVNFNFDIRSKDKTEWLYDLAPVLGLICFSNQRDVDECKARGFNNTMVLQSSVDMDVYKPDGFVMRPNFVSFIGNNYAHTNIEFPLAEQRKEMVYRLSRKYGNFFGVWGIGWESSQLTNTGQEQKIYSTSIIAINQNNFNEELYTSDRIWRIMATGTACLTSYFKGIEKLFTRYHHLDWWETLDELENKVDYYLHNSELASQMGERGRNHVLTNHTWTARIKEMMDFVYELKLYKDYVFVPKPEACMKVGAHVIDGAIPLPTDEHFNNRVCDCGKLKWLWQQCECGSKEFQLRAQENI